MTMTIDEIVERMRWLEEAVETLHQLSPQEGREWWARHSSPASQCWDLLPNSLKLRCMVTARRESQSAKACES